MKIIYHSRDLDGYTSGAILKMKFPEAELIGYDYGQPIPWIDKGEDIILVDVSFPMVDLFDMAANSKSMVWIDHHASAIKDYEACDIVPVRLEVVLMDGIAACELAWNWAFPDRELPVAVRLLGQYDTWRNQNKEFWDRFVLPFQYGMRTICNSPETFPMDIMKYIEVFELNEIINIGNIILVYQSEQDAKSCENAFEFDWKGYRIIAKNGGSFNSNAFKAVYNPEKHDIMMPFKFTGKYWVFSLYTEKDIDCSALAKSMGGGGHKKAAGFQITSVHAEEFPFSV